MRHARLAAVALLAAACAHGPQKPQPPGAPAAAADSNAIEVQDAVHGVKYQLPPDSDPWQVTREGTARAASGVEAEVSSFALPKDAAPALCRDKARRLVHKYAAGGAAWAMLPIPIPTSPTLTALEAHMIYWIARLYGESPSHVDTIIMAAGLEVGSTGLRQAARYLVGLVPIVGWGIKGVIAGAAIETMGQLVIKHFEGKYPDKLVA